jgi:hypothetical protein
MVVGAIGQNLFTVSTKMVTVKKKRDATVVYLSRTRQCTEKKTDGIDGLNGIQFAVLRN